MLCHASDTCKVVPCTYISVDAAVCNLWQTLGNHTLVLFSTPVVQDYGNLLSKAVCSDQLFCPQHNFVQ